MLIIHRDVLASQPVSLVRNLGFGLRISGPFQENLGSHVTGPIGKGQKSVTKVLAI